VVPEDVSKMTANLKAPIVINLAKNKGKQMLMDNSPYEIKHLLLDELLNSSEIVNQEEK
jgi:flagellar assembly factor FliW